MTNSETPQSIWSFYAAAARAAWNRLLEHFFAQVAVSLICAAIASAIAVSRGEGDLSLAYALWGSAGYVAVAALAFFISEPVRMYHAQIDQREAIERSRVALLEEKNEREEIKLEFVKPGAAKLPGEQFALPGIDVHLVNIIVYNRGAGAYFSASVVDQSLRGLEETYPMGSFQLRWQTPNDTDRQWIAHGTDARVEVAVAFAGRRVAFLGPRPVRWAVQNAVQDTIEGLIDFAVMGRDARQRVRFSLSIGPEHPVDLTIEPVAHD